MPILNFDDERRAERAKREAVEGRARTSDYFATRAGVIGTKFISQFAIFLRSIVTSSICFDDGVDHGVAGINSRKEVMDLTLTTFANCKLRLFHRWPF